MIRFVLICLILTGILMMKTTKAHDESKNSGELQLQQPLKLMKLRRLVYFLQKAETSIANPPESSGDSSELKSAKDEDEKEPSGEAEAPVARKILRHRSSDKSVAGGGVIIGGLVTAIFAAVYCYIRATRRKDGENIKLVSTGSRYSTSELPTK